MLEMKETTSGVDHYRMLIGGQWVESASGQVLEVENPTNEEIFATVQAANAADAQRALEAAREAQPVWAAFPAVERGNRLMRLTEKLTEKREHFARLLVREQGKTIGLAYGEVDANQSYSYHDVLKIADDLAAFDLTFLEEPLPINDIDAMAALVAAVKVPIAAGENYYTRFEFRDILVKRVVNIIQPDIIHAGGITETRKIADMASAWNVPLAPHIHATVGVAASIHLLTATPNTLAAEYITSGGSYKLRQALYGQAFMSQDGWISASDEPGLGIHIDESVFETYQPKG